MNALRPEHPDTLAATTVRKVHDLARHPDRLDDPTRTDVAALITDRRIEQAVERALAALPGQPAAASFDSPKVSGGGGGEGRDLDRVDHATADLARASAAARRAVKHARSPRPELVAKQLRRDVYTLVTFADRWTPRNASPLDHRDSVANQRLDGCESCARVGEYSPPEGQNTTDSDGRKWRLCRWCRGRLEAINEQHGVRVVPSIEACERHRDGRPRVPLMLGLELGKAHVGTGGAFTWRNPR